MGEATKERGHDHPAGEQHRAAQGLRRVNPMYVFTYDQRQSLASVPIHAHRDNVTGNGFAFAVYHPGTGLPEQPWTI